MESKSTYFILIVIVAVLALSLAAIAGYMFIVQGMSRNNKAGEDAILLEDAKEVPGEDELIKISLYDSARYFNLKNENSDKSSIIQVNVTLKCYNKLKLNKKADVEKIITGRSEEIQELVVRFFMTLTADDVKNPAMMDMAKEKLTNQINDLLNEGIEEKEDIVYKVVFSQWLFQ